MKGKVSGKIMIKCVGLKAKAYSSLTDNGGDEKSKRHKKYVVKGKVEFENYKSCLEATELQNKINHLETNKTDKDNLLKIIKNS